MNDLMKTASGLDKFLNVMFILLKVAMVFLIVGICIISAYFIFDLEPGMVGTDFEQVDLGFLTLSVAEAYMPDVSKILLVMAVDMATAFAVCFFCRKLVTCFRGILAPMKEGLPFQNAVSGNLKKAAKNIMILGILVNLAQIYADMALPILFDLPGLLLSEKITHITIHGEIDLSFLLTAAVMLLLSYVFHYGEELQQLSDETV